MCSSLLRSKSTLCNHINDGERWDVCEPLFSFSRTERRKQRCIRHETRQKACPAENKSESSRWRGIDPTYRNAGVWQLARRAQSLHNRGVWQYAGHVTAGASLSYHGKHAPARSAGLRCVARHIALIISFYVTGGPAYRPAIPDTLGVSRQLGPRFPPLISVELPAFCGGRDKIITKIT